MINPGRVGSRGYLYGKSPLEIGVRGYLGVTVEINDIRRDADGIRKQEYKLPQINARLIYEEEMEIMSIVQAFLMCQN